MASTSKVPYLIDAFRQWAMDFSFTPQLIIDGSHPDLVVPFDKILMTEGEFVLNIADRAIDGFVCRGEEILFDASFSGRSHHIEIPFEAVIGAFTPETGDGVCLVTFRQPSSTSSRDRNSSPKKPTRPRKRKSVKPHLTIVK